jgi:hypothetical protein
MRSSLALKPTETFRIVFFIVLNNNFSAQDWQTELKLVWLEPSSHQDSEHFRNNFLAICEKKTSMQNN